ncbi:uncharacterized protein LOC120176518 [Hibiscus syriacus]|uniref:uncharacterized protein LOC120176518 n=1 Tax=Hibiscus syriacus TaxID=106335 RepID=UPI0019227E0A|nr:uncharacterized protein LOC120176518 [Hibiscus syriacus]
MCRAIFQSWNPLTFWNLSIAKGLNTLRASTISEVLECKLLHIIGENSIKNIERNAVLQIQSLAQRWARMQGRGSFGNQFFCCFPGNEVPANEFEHRSVNSPINLTRAPNGRSGSRFLAFALCFLADLWFADGGVGFFCKCQLTAASGEKLMRESRVSWRWDRGYRYKDYVDLVSRWNRINRYKGHVFIVFNKDMFIRDNDYEEASFEIYKNGQLGRQYKGVEWGVHVFYVDAESNSISDAMSCDAKRRLNNGWYGW